MAEPGKVIKPRSRSAQFSLGSVLTAKGNVVPFFNPVDYLQEGDLVLYYVEQITCNLTYKEVDEEFQFPIAVLDINYPPSLFNDDIEEWKKGNCFSDLWKTTWEYFLTNNPCGLEFLELNIYKEDFECLWKTNEVYLASIESVE